MCKTRSCTGDLDISPVCAAPPLTALLATLSVASTAPSCGLPPTISIEQDPRMHTCAQGLESLVARCRGAEAPEVSEQRRLSGPGRGARAAVLRFGSFAEAYAARKALRSVGPGGPPGVRDRPETARRLSGSPRLMVRQRVGGRAARAAGRPAGRAAVRRWPVERWGEEAKAAREGDDEPGRASTDRRRRRGGASRRQAGDSRCGHNSREARGWPR